MTPTTPPEPVRAPTVVLDDCAGVGSLLCRRWALGRARSGRVMEPERTLYLEGRDTIRPTLRQTCLTIADLMEVGLDEITVTVHLPESRQSEAEAIAQRHGAGWGT